MTQFESAIVDEIKTKIVVSRAGLLVPPDRLCPRCKMEEIVDMVQARGRMPVRAMLGLACLEEWRALEERYGRGWRPEGRHDPFHGSHHTNSGPDRGHAGDALFEYLRSMMGAYSYNHQQGGTIHTWERTRKK